MLVWKGHCHGHVGSGPCCCPSVFPQRTSSSTTLPCRFPFQHSVASKLHVWTPTPQLHLLSCWRCCRTRLTTLGRWPAGADRIQRLYLEGVVGFGRVPAHLGGSQRHCLFCSLLGPHERPQRLCQFCSVLSLRLPMWPLHQVRISGPSFPGGAFERVCTL